MTILPAVLITAHLAQSIGPFIPPVRSRAARTVQRPGCSLPRCPGRDLSNEVR